MEMLLRANHRAVAYPRDHGEPISGSNVKGAHPSRTAIVYWQLAPSRRSNTTRKRRKSSRNRNNYADAKCYTQDKHDSTESILKTTNKNTDKNNCLWTDHGLLRDARQLTALTEVVGYNRLTLGRWQ